ncbi:telomerase reverse transcriptase isoform X1 [Scyliorhinus torazame]|uniref:telomerase reverse transcriptase isoform X1 n=1 Tax=Scyliorhinus torazame TaxID=75743 RepID=UPI003B5AC822
MNDSRLAGLLASVYPRVCSVQRFIAQTGAAAPPALLRAGDPDTYQRFISHLIVCVPGEARAVCRPLTFQQLSAQSDVVLRVIQRICAKGKRNVLCFGYACANETSFIRIRSAPNICSYQPNPTTVTIKNSVLWKTLLSRIGDDIMMYLLEHCSLFMLVPPSCCFQLCGVPIYSLITSGARLSSTWLRQYPAKYWRNISLKCVQKRARFYKGFLTRSRKWKERLPTDGAENKVQAAEPSRRKHRTTLRGPGPASAKRAKVDGGRWASEDVATTQSLKRCLNDDKVESPAKRLKGRQLSAVVEGMALHPVGQDALHVENTSCQPPEVTGQSSVTIDQPNIVAFEWKGEVCNADGNEPKNPKFSACVSADKEGTSADSKRQDSDATVPEPTEGRDCNSSPRGPFRHREETISSGKDVCSPVFEVENSEQVKNTGAENESAKSGDNSTIAGEQQNSKELGQGGARNPNQGGIFTARSASSIHRTVSVTGKNTVAHRQRLGMAGVSAHPILVGTQQQTSRDSAAVRNKRKRATIYIERGNIMYCSNTRERLPNTFILNRLQDLSTGGQKLVETIFLDTYSSAKKQAPAQPGNSWRKKRFPKRYWQMRNIFFRLLRNHKRCPYVQLLTRNCLVDTQRGCKVLSASNAVANAESNSLPVIKVSHGSFSCPDAELDTNCPVGETIPPIAKQGQLLSKNFKDDNSMRTDLLGHSSTIDRGSEEQTHPLRPSERPGLCSQPSHLPEAAPMKHKTNGKPSMSRDSDSVRDPSGSDKDLLRLLKQYSSLLQVHRFVRECLLKVVPDELWGSHHNRSRFLKNVKKFISLGKFDRFSCSQLMWKMRVTDCTWLQLTKGQHFVPATEHQLREAILSRFLFWLMDTYVVQLLKSFFYITETMFMKNMLFYYRKCVWNGVQRIGVRKLQEKVQLRPISHKDVEQKQRQKTLPPPSKLRFIPKKNGLRPIVKMRSKAAPKSSAKGVSFRKIQHPDSQMKALFGVLNYECRQKPALMGSSVLGLDDIYKAWRGFVLRSLKAGKVRESHPYYFVKADVTGAYDTIPHAKLMEVISGILDPTMQESYCIRRYTKVWMDSGGQIRKSFKSQVFTMMDLLPNMKEFVSHLQQNTSLQNTVLVEQGLTLNETSGQMFGYFKQMIENSTIRIGDKYYVQCCGIPQGSLLSTLLCSLCYGDMENRLFGGIQEDGLMLRLVDDFLLVTPHLAHAKSFLRVLAAGIPEYGCFISPQKTVVNFALDDNLPGCSKAKSLPRHSLFPWCGLLFDTQTLEVYCDYSSYANTSIRSSLTFNCRPEAGENLRRKLLAVLKLKCHHIFLDLEVNTLRTVSINVYKIFLLQAYRFHACVLRLPFGRGVRDNPSFFLGVVSDMVACCYSILKAKNRGILLGYKDASGPFPYEAAHWLCCRAFTVKLSNHKAVYKCLLGPLRTCRAKLQRILPDSTVQLLQSIIEPALHRDFAVILD